MLLVPLLGAVEPVVVGVGAAVEDGVEAAGAVAGGAVGGDVGVDPADESGTGAAVVVDVVLAGRLLTFLGFGGSMVNCPPWRRSLP